MKESTLVNIDRTSMPSASADLNEDLFSQALKTCGNNTSSQNMPVRRTHSQSSSNSDAARNNRARPYSRPSQSDFPWLHYPVSFSSSGLRSTIPLFVQSNINDSNAAHILLEITSNNTTQLPTENVLPPLRPSDSTETQPRNITPAIIVTSSDNLNLSRSSPFPPRPALNREDASLTPALQVEKQQETNLDYFPEGTKEILPKNNSSEGPTYIIPSKNKKIPERKVTFR